AALGQAPDLDLLGQHPQGLVPGVEVEVLGGVEPGLTAHLDGHGGAGGRPRQEEQPDGDGEVPAVGADLAQDLAVRPVAGPRQGKKDGQRRGILHVALELFRAQGFEATRVQDITERLRISEGTFFNYFPSKAAVLDAAAVDILDRATILLHHDVADHDRAVLDRLEELVRDFAANFAGDREFAVQL